MAFSINVPPQESEIRFQPFYDNWAAIANIQTLFDVSWSGLQGELLVVREDESGPTVASNLDSELRISAAGRPFSNFRPEVVEINTSLELQHSTHVGRLLYCTNSSAIIISLSAAETELDTGIYTNFACTIIRGGAGTVQINFGSLTNRHPSLHTRITSGLAATLFFDYGRGEVFFLGGTEA